MKMPSFALPAFIALLTLGASPLNAASAQSDAAAIYKSTGIKGGIVVQIGVGDGQLTAALRQSERYQVEGIDTDPNRVLKARESLYAKGVYGPVSVNQFDGKLMPYIDNLVNLVVAEDLGQVPMTEVIRALAPNGVAWIKQNGEWKKTVKPRPPEMDDWTHYFYDARGNAVSKDTFVAPPDRLQWVGSPRWSRHHDRISSLSAQVSSGGRLFYIMDEGSRISILMPSKWFLTARDAFNGTVLWKQPITKWQEHLWPLKSGPTELTRRLVADGDKIYVTMAIDAPVTCLDGATGETIRTYPETKGAEEILHVNGTLFVLVNPGLWALTDFAPKYNTGDQKRVETEFNWDEKPRHLYAIEAATGKVLWKKESAKIAPLTITSDGKRLVYHDGDKLVCLNAASGKVSWSDTPASKRKLFEYNYGPRVVIHDNTVLYAGGDGAMKGIDADSGHELWHSAHEKSGYRSPEDLIVAGGLVWNAGTTSGGQSGEFKGRDIRTGEIKKQFLPDIDTYWFHHRCYIAKATENYILPSRTGIEFVDMEKQHWDINHWVRGACLYGVMPCNGLVYAGPHNCACYPEAKLDGLNALAAGRSPHPAPTPDAQRLVQGPAWGKPLEEKSADAKDWPTFRHDVERSGYTDQPLMASLEKAWDINLPGPLSTLTIAAGKVFVAQIDAHVVNALDANTGKPIWRYLAGGRVDSPPTYWQGRVIFGSMDGWVYCLRATDGELIWRYQAAPGARKHTAFEQVESVWPVHGSVLVDSKGIVSLVSGRSVFLDGGLHFIRLEASTGKKLVETVYDDKDPDTGRDLQERLKTLQMPVGLNDILSSDDHWIYLRSQKIDPNGKRVDIGPVSGNAAEQGASQRGEGAHIFAPMGFLDDTWFHRSYWVYGKNFAGGHNGYYQAGKYAPAGRILVFDDKNVYGYAREPKYLKWTTTMEHQLFASAKEAPDVAVDPASVAGNKKKGAGGGKAAGKAAPAAAAAAPAAPNVKFAADAEKLDPANKPITVEAWIMPDGKDGVIVSHGGNVTGYMLSLEDGRPGFSVRSDKQTGIAQSARPLEEGWHHIAGVLTQDKHMILYVDGQRAAEAKAPGLVSRKPAIGLQLGVGGNSLVSEFGHNAPYTGMLDQFAVYYRALDEGEILQHFAQATAIKPGSGAAMFCSFDNGNARDDSGTGTPVNGVVSGVETGKGKVGVALWFHKPVSGNTVAAAAAATAPGGSADKEGAPPAQAGTFVQYQWTRDVPIITRAMAMAGKTMFLSGPPDTLNEEYAFERLTQKDPAIQQEIAEQDAALDGKRGGTMWAVSVDGGKMSQDFKLESPPVWDGMAIAQGRLYVATIDGKVTCYGKPKN